MAGPLGFGPRSECIVRKGERPMRRKLSVLLGVLAVSLMLQGCCCCYRHGRGGDERWEHKKGEMREEGKEENEEKEMKEGKKGKEGKEMGEEREEKEQKEKAAPEAPKM